MAMTLAIRAMKARRTKGRCPFCEAVMVVGVYIVLIPGAGWAHSRCAIQQITTTEDSQ
jgi:hypothetical protein